MNEWDELRTKILIVMMALFLGWLWGWTQAHHTVAQECRRLGGFYVGKSNFKCSAIEPKVVDEAEAPEAAE